MNTSRKNKPEWWYELKDLWNKFDPIGVFIMAEYTDVHDEYESYIVPTFTRLENEENFDQLKSWVTYICHDYMGMSELNNEYIAQFINKLQEWYARYKAS